MIDFTDYWTQHNLSVIMIPIGVIAAMVAFLMGNWWLWDLKCFRTIIGEYVWCGIAILSTVVTIAAIVMTFVLRTPTLGKQLGEVYGVQVAQASDDGCGRTLNRPDLLKPDNLICEVHYFQDGKPQTGQLVIQGNKVGLTDSQGAYLKEVGR